MISAFIGHDVANKIAQSKKLAQDVEEFYLKKSAKREVKIIKEVEEKEKRTSSKEKLEMLAHQVPVLARAKKAFGHPAWGRLSKAVGDKVSSSKLASVYSGRYSISNMELWSEIEKAVIDQEKRIGKQHGNKRT